VGINPNFVLIPSAQACCRCFTAPGGLAQQFPKAYGEPRPARLAWGRQGDGRRRVVIEVEGLTVRFSGVTPIDRMSVTFPGGTCG
jgi:hypothetical protein